MIERFLLIRCDICQAPSDMEDAVVATETEIRRDLREQGWQFERNSRLHDKTDRCLACAKGGSR